MKQEKRKKSYWVRYGNTIIYYAYDKIYQQYFKGVSVCQPEDTFDLETGICIARQKAVLKKRSWYVRVIDDRLELIKRMKALEPELRQQREAWQNKVETSFKQLVETLDKLK